MKNVPRTVIYANVSSNHLYMLYYVVANEYPLRPVLTSSVSNFSVDTSYESWKSLMWASLLLLLAMTWK